VTKIALHGYLSLLNITDHTNKRIGKMHNYQVSFRTKHPKSNLCIHLCSLWCEVQIPYITLDFELPIANHFWADFQQQDGLLSLIDD